MHHDRRAQVSEAWAWLTEARLLLRWLTEYCFVYKPLRRQFYCLQAPGRRLIGQFKTFDLGQSFFLRGGINSKPIENGAYWRDLWRAMAALAIFGLNGCSGIVCARRFNYIYAPESRVNVIQGHKRPAEQLVLTSAINYPQMVASCSCLFQAPAFT